MKETINKKAIAPIFIAINSYFLSYGIPKLLIHQKQYHYLSSGLDDLIKPFAPAVIIYVLSYFQWAYALFELSKQLDLKKVYRFCLAIIIGSIIGMVIFIVYPTAIYIKPLQDSSLCAKALNYIYSIDYGTECFPSFHTMCSTFSCFILKACNSNKKTRIVNYIFTILVLISLLLTKQHVLIDIPAGFVLTLISLYISRLIIKS